MHLFSNKSNSYVAHTAMQTPKLVPIAWARRVVHSFTAVQAARGALVHSQHPCVTPPFLQTQL